MFQSLPPRLCALPLLTLTTLLLANGAQAVDPLDAPAAPSEAGSAMYDLSDLYNRLVSGAAGDKRVGAFTEPASGPTGATLYSLDAIMSRMPVVNDANGATAAEVVSGKTFWGLKSGGDWGLQTGTLDISNLKDTSSGDATAGDLLLNKKAWVDGVEVTGSMENHGAVTLTPSTSDQVIAAGYHNGSGKVVGDGDLTAGNIRKDVELFGVTGSALVSSGDAAAGDVLTGKTFSNATAAGVTGSMVNQGAVTLTPGTSDQTIAAGYHDGSGKVVGDSDLTAGNIKKGVTIFGVTGTLAVPSGSTNDPVNRYMVVAADGSVIRDNVTGLEWKRCPEGMSWNAINNTCDGTASTWTWNLATVTFKNPDSNGFHLPTINELRTLVYCSSGSPVWFSVPDLTPCSGGHNVPTIFSAAFPGTPALSFWSDSSSSVGRAWCVYFTDGEVSPCLQSYATHVRLVRSGQ